MSEHEFERVQRNIQRIANSLDTWEKWVLSTMRTGAVISVTSYREWEYYHVGRTIYLGGDPDFEEKQAAVKTLLAYNLLSPMPSLPTDTERHLRLNDDGVAVLQALVDENKLT